jgi:hypothetical protein
MARKRLSDVNAVKSMRVGGSHDEGYSESTTIRRITNGYVTTKSRCDDSGYKSEEIFTEQKPSTTESSLVGESSLRDAAKYLKGK